MVILNRRRTVFSYYYYGIIMSFSIVVVALVTKPKQIVAYICSNSRPLFGVTTSTTGVVRRTINTITPIPNYNYKRNINNYNRRRYYYYFSSSSLKQDNNDNNCRDVVTEKDGQEQQQQQQQQEQQQSFDLTMDNLYCEWTLEDDKLLFNNRHQSTIQLASLLGRGLRGVEARLGKLLDINTFAYQRLFVNTNRKQKQQQSSSDSSYDIDDELSESNKNKKLIPACEVLRRIKWDNTLNSNDFFILHYDRVEDNIKETCFNAPNTNIKGNSTSFVDALPEHRIVGIKYKEQIVWDREKRIDLVFTTTTNNDSNDNESDSSDDNNYNYNKGGIHRIIQEYDVWKQNEDKQREIYRQRQEEINIRIQQVLGEENNEILHELSNSIQQKLVSKNPKVSAKIESERYVKESLELFRQVRNNNMNSNNPSCSIPTSDYYSLDILSEYVSLLLPNVTVRDMLLNEIDLQMKRIIPTNTGIVPDTTTSQQKQKQQKGSSSNNNRILPVLDENDIIETYVKGSGPGGQKINKTSNRVVLVHVPTQIRVECQDTRTVHQNRKIARKLLQEKLDVYINGSQSKSQQKNQILANKKQKAKSKSKLRLLRKQQQQSKNDTNDDTNNDDTVESQQSFSDLIDPDDAI